LNKNAVEEFKSELALELDRKEEFPLELYRKAAKLGFTSIFPVRVWWARLRAS
jgi:hypothetical protein